MTTEVLSPRSKDAKDSARDKWSRGHRVTQDHGHRGPSHFPSVDEEWDNYAPRRVKLAEQPAEDFNALVGAESSGDSYLDELAYDYDSMSDYIIDDALEEQDYDDEDEDTSPLDFESPAYEAAYDELSEFLDRNGIVGADRVAAAEAFKADPAIQREFLLLASDLASDAFPTSYDQVDSANRLSDRSRTDYAIDGMLDDDEGDYHVPHMSVRH